MKFSELTLKAYKQLHDLIESNEIKDSIQFLEFDYPDDQLDFIYGLQENDFTRELANTFNQFAYWLNRIAKWEYVLLAYTEEEANELRYEFTAVQFDYCLHSPYKFKSRLAFCATHLCYTNAIAKKLIDKDKVKRDEDIKLDSLIALAHHWPNGLRLVEALKAVDDKEYRNATSNYRNRSQHQHPKNLDFGYITNIVRSFPAGAHVSYSVGESPPLKTTTVLPVLISEAERMRAAFFVYRSLIEQHQKGDITTKL
jgi:hypothetical protein